MFRIRAVECTGRTIKGSLQRSNPFRRDKCGRVLCFLCESGGRGSCEKESVNYDITCIGCEEDEMKSVYHGETSKNTYTRGKQHLKDLEKRRYCRVKHGGNILGHKNGGHGTLSERCNDATGSGGGENKQNRRERTN